MTISCDDGCRAVFNVGWGNQCGVCGLATLHPETDALLRVALIKSGIKLYELPVGDATNKKAAPLPKE